MTENFADILVVGGKTNSLGRANEVIEIVLGNKARLDELYTCLFHEDAWARMRAADALEKICREHAEWLLPYIDKFQTELANTTQPSIQWHIAQIYQQVALDGRQKAFVLNWLKGLLSTTAVDWIVAANAMDTLMQFTEDGSFPRSEMLALLSIQRQHKSKSVVKRADKHLARLTTA